MNIEILGTGCKRCDQLHENTLTAAAEFDDSFGIEEKKYMISNISQKWGFSCRRDFSLTAM